MGRVKQNLYREASKFQLSYASVCWIVIAPFIIAILLTLLSLPFFYQLHPYIWGENKIVETIQFLVFILAAIQSLFVAWNFLVQMEHPAIWGFYLAFSLVMFFIAMEEIAWGQQYLGFQSPDFVRNYNVQNEFTLHNFTFLQDRTDILNLGFGIAGLVGIWVGKNERKKKYGVPGFLVTWLVLIIVLSVIGVYIDLFVEVRPVNYSLYIQTETTELLIGLVGFLFIWMICRGFIMRLKKSPSVVSVYHVDDTLELHTIDSRIITILISSLPWLVGADPDGIGNMVVTKNGTSVLWKDLHYEYPIRQILKVSAKSGKDFQPVKPPAAIYYWIAFITGIISLFWMVMIPNDQKNIWILGLSKMRFSMILVGGGFLVVLAFLIWRKGKQRKVDLPSIPDLNKWLSKLEILKTIAFSTFLGTVGFSVFLAVSFSLQDVYIRGIMTRLAPWLFWGWVLFIEILVWAMREILVRRRLSLVRAHEIIYDNNQVVFFLNGGREVTVPTSLLPRWFLSLEKKLEEILYIGDGVRLKWSQHPVDFLVENLLTRDLTLG